MKNTKKYQNVIGKTLQEIQKHATGKDLMVWRYVDYEYNNFIATFDLRLHLDLLDGLSVMDLTDDIILFYIDLNKVKYDMSNIDTCISRSIYNAYNATDRIRTEQFIQRILPEMQSSQYADTFLRWDFEDKVKGTQLHNTLKDYALKEFTNDKLRFQVRRGFLVSEIDRRLFRDISEERENILPILKLNLKRNQWLGTFRINEITLSNNGMYDFKAEFNAKPLVIDTISIPFSYVSDLYYETSTV